MLRWMSVHGYGADSLPGQAAYMAHEAMTGGYKRTRDILLNADPANRAGNTPIITREFEAPAVTNYRTGNVNQAAGVPPQGSGAPVGVERLGPGETPAPSAGAVAPGAMLAPSGDNPAAFIVHHTGGRGTPESVVSGWRNDPRGKGIGTQFIMDREGNIHGTAKEYGYGGRGHFLHSVVPGVSNRTAVGMEIIARDDADITATQRAKAIEFINRQYPSTPVYGHSEVSPSDRTNEGVDIARTIRQQRAEQATRPKTAGASPL